MAEIVKEEFVIVENKFHSLEMSSTVGFKLNFNKKVFFLLNKECAEKYSVHFVCNPSDSGHFVIWSQNSLHPFSVIDLSSKNNVLCASDDFIFKSNDDSGGVHWVYSDGFVGNCSISIEVFEGKSSKCVCFNFLNFKVDKNGASLVCSNKK